MKISFLIIATEVLNGKVNDANNQCLAQFLRNFHMEIDQTMIVKDSPEAIQNALNLLWSSSDLVITSGGLGPTKDDLTKASIASFFGKKLNLSQDAMRIAIENYKRFDRVYPGEEHGYSFLPEDFTALNNPTGFAPALFFHQQGKYLLCGPGVPREFKGIIETHLEELVLEKNKSKKLFKLLSFKTRKVPEEKIFKEIDPSLWDKLEELGSVSSLPHYGGVDIGVHIEALTPDELEQKEQGVLAVINSSPVKSAIWHTGLESIEEVILMKAQELKINFGFAESATGGLCSHRITSISGASKSFKGSVICYDTSVKIQTLNVKQQTVDSFSVVSKEVAFEMAQGMRDYLDLDIAVSITGLAGPEGGTPERPVGTVCIGIAIKDGCESFQTKLFGDREQLKTRFSQLALMSLLEKMEKFAGY